MSIRRPLWLRTIEQSWKRAPIVWLSGVRRVGKTTLAKSLTDATYLNCDLPSVAERLSDPESFLRSVATRVLILDEVHQLSDPSRLLKIAADTAHGLRLLATGSSTLAATRKFKDSLAGRKRTIYMQPVLSSELEAFGIRDVRRRLLRGGLPQPLLAESHDPEFYAEWMDSFFARDIQELFRVEKRVAFLRLLELLMRQSGGLCDVSALGRATELSRPTVMNYLEVLQVSHAIHVIRPFHGNGKQEIVRQPKVYAFDTGFVAFARGWNELRPNDCGVLYEHLVLESLLNSPLRRNIRYWRDKAQREIDFVLIRDRDAVDIVECKWNSKAFDASALRAFRTCYPNGNNYLVTPDTPSPLCKAYDGIDVQVMSLDDLIVSLRKNTSAVDATE